MKIKDFMTKQVLSVDKNMTAKEFVRFVQDKNITGTPVLDGERLVGVVSVSDIIARSDYIEREMGHCEDCYELDTTTGLVEVHRYYTDELFEKPIHELMTPVAELVWVAPDDDLDVAVKAFLETPVHRLLVMQQKKIVGMISTKDVLRALAKQPASKTA
jgi:predicted transcriptional regulator